MGSSVTKRYEDLHLNKHNNDLSNLEEDQV